VASACKDQKSAKDSIEQKSGKTIYSCCTCLSHLEREGVLVLSSKFLSSKNFKNSRGNFTGTRSDKQFVGVWAISPRWLVVRVLGDGGGGGSHFVDESSKVCCGCRDCRRPHKRKTRRLQASEGWMWRGGS
jgi:Zn-finger protein